MNIFISVDQADPYGFIAGQHFNWVLKRYGAPVIILNLVKVTPNILFSKNNMFVDGIKRVFMHVLNNTQDSC